MPAFIKIYEAKLYLLIIFESDVDNKLFILVSWKSVCFLHYSLFFGYLLKIFTLLILFFQFLLIFRKASLGELQIDGLKKLAELSEIDVGAEGVGGAKNFFEAKVSIKMLTNFVQFICVIKDFLLCTRDVAWINLPPVKFLKIIPIGLHIIIWTKNII